MNSSKPFSLIHRGSRSRLLVGEHLDMDPLLLKVQDGSGGSMHRSQSVRQHSGGRWSRAAREVQREPRFCFVHQCNWKGTHKTKQQKSGTQPNCPPKIHQGLLVLSFHCFPLLFLFSLTQITLKYTHC